MPACANSVLPAPSMAIVPARTPGRPRRVPTITIPPSASRANSFNPARESPTASTPISAVAGPLTALTPSFHSACTTIAMMTGLTPYISHPTCGVSP